MLCTGTVYSAAAFSDGNPGSLPFLLRHNARYRTTNENLNQTKVQIGIINKDDRVAQSDGGHTPIESLATLA